MMHLEDPVRIVLKPIPLINISLVVMSEIIDGSLLHPIELAK
jgi:hypothetical protein